MAYYANQADMFLKRAEQCRKKGARYWAMADQAQRDGKSSEEVEILRKQAGHYYNMAKENLAKAEESRGKTWK
jgi:hypothetical protein